MKTFGAILFILAAVACTKKGSVSEVTPQEAMGELRNDFAVLIDVREDDEVAGGVAAPAKRMPMSKIEANDPAWQELLKNTPKDKKLIFYCSAGGRADKAAEKAAAEGFRAGNMGGYDDWVKAGLPVTK